MSALCSASRSAASSKFPTLDCLHYWEYCTILDQLQGRGEDELVRC
jgi:hypothetical protein